MGARNTGNSGKKKGPAEAATSPSHGSIHRGTKDMNDRTDTTALTEGASTSKDTDPCLAFVNGWNDALKENEAIAKATRSDEAAQNHWRRHVVPFVKQAERNKVPAATTREGAVAALQRVLDWDDMEEQDAGMIRAALAFLKAPNASPDPFLERMERYQSDFRAFNAAEGPDDEISPATTLQDDLRFGRVSINSAAGVSAALHFVMASDMIGDMLDEELVKAVIAYVDGRAS